MRIAISDYLQEGSPEKAAVPQDLQNYLAQHHACYVLITCGLPNADGKMQVEMTYEGDACLASYLIEGAQGLIKCDEDPT